jgi:RecB family exonuclease
MSGVTKRINGGKGHWYKLDGAKVDGVTSVIGAGVPKPALPNWAAREVAAFAADNLDLLANLDRDAAIDLLKGAPWRDRDKAARRGTEVHALAERLVAGDEIDVPEELTGHVDSYLRFLDDWRPTDELIEVVVGHHAHRWMGTLDMIATLNDGRRWLLDIKTTRSGIFGEVALQLAAYRHADFMLDADGREQPMPPVDACGAIWVRADGYDLVPVTADANVYRTFRYAQQIAEFTRTARDLVGDVLTPEHA